MKVSRKILSALIAAALAPAAAQAAKDDANTLELKSRLIHFDRDFETASNDRSQTALGLQLNFESAYFGDIIGFGLSGYSVTELGSSGRVTSDVLRADGDGDFHDSFGKIGQAFIKVKYQDLLQAKIGRQTHKSMLVGSSGSRAIPNTFSGISASVTPMKGLGIYAAIYDEWSPRAEAHFKGFRTDRTSEGAIDYIGVLGAKYKTGPFALEIEYLNSKDYLSKVGVVGSYTMALANKSKLALTAGVHTSRDDGSLFVTGAEGGDLDDEDVAGSAVGVTASDNDANAMYLEAEWNHGPLMIGGAVAHFDGLWIEDNFTDDHGTNPFPTGGVLADITNNDETVVMLRAGYDWSAYVTGLKTTVSIKRGTGARNSHVPALGEADEQEVALDLRYKVAAVKGLSFRYLLLDYSSDKTGRVDGVKEDETDHRIYLDYNYRFF